MVNQTMHFTSSHKSFLFFPKKLKKNLSYKNHAQCNVIVWLKNSVNCWRASATCLVCRVSGETWTSKVRQNGCHPTLICKRQKRIILRVLISVITNILLFYVFFFFNLFAMENEMVNMKMWPKCENCTNLTAIKYRYDILNTILRLMLNLFTRRWSKPKEPWPKEGPRQAAHYHLDVYVKQWLKTIKW